jgi:hypothetical protein
MDELPPFKVRPRFKVETSASIDDLVDRITNALEQEEATCVGGVHVMGGTIGLPYEDRHYWSPQLSLSFEQTEQGTIVRGLYGPRPSVWGMFVFFYAFIAIATMIVATIGFSRLTLGGSAGILWWVPVLLLIFLSLYLVSYTGQKVGKKQMITLHRFIEEATGLDF